MGLGPRAYEAEDEGGAQPSVVSMRLSMSKDLLITGTDDGSIGVRSVLAPEFFARLLQHDGDRGHVVAAVASYDETFLLSAGTDGLLVVYNLRKSDLTEEANVRTALGVAERGLETPIDPEYAFQREDVEGSNQVAVGFIEKDSSTKTPADIDANTVNNQEPVDITDPSTYSIQDAKLKVRTSWRGFVLGMGRSKNTFASFVLCVELNRRRRIIDARQQISKRQKSVSLLQK